MKSMLKRLARALPAQSQHPTRSAPPTLPLHGYTQHRLETAFVDSLSDEDLAELNELLPWNCFTVDRHGRRFGNAAWKGKREEPQAVPDRRIVLLNERFDLAARSVLEFGCFEGVHTLGLLQFSPNVKAIDARITNVVKTIVRTAFFGYQPTVFKYDVEKSPPDVELLGSDVLHHVGVLYHLRDPVRHLLDIGNYIRLGVMLDSHYAEPQEATSTYESAGRSVHYKKVGEGGHSDPFSGIYDHSKWLTLETIEGLLKETGFDEVEIAETRAERNGPRALIFARRT